MLILPGEERMSLAGVEASGFRGKLLEGGAFDLAKEKGKIVVLDFWATWCGPCKAELPSVQKLHHEFEGKVEFVGVNDEEPETVKKFLQQNGYDMQVCMDGNQAIHRLYGVTAIPRLLVLNRDGLVQRDYLGTQSEDTLRAAIQEVADGVPFKPLPRAAPHPEGLKAGAMLQSLDPAVVDDASRSIKGNTPATIDFLNRSSGPVDLYWIDYEGNRHVARVGLRAGETFSGGTFLTHPFLAVVSGTRGTTAHDTGTRIAAFLAITPNTTHNPAIGDTAIIEDPVASPSSGPPVSISAVTFEGSAADPVVRVLGRGLNPKPAVTAPGVQSVPGDDYGTSLHLFDFTNHPGFSAGLDNPSMGRHDAIGLVISSYDDDQISFSLGQNYSRDFYPRHALQLNEGDSFTLYLRNAHFSGTVHYTTGDVAPVQETRGALFPPLYRDQSAEPPKELFLSLTADMLNGMYRRDNFQNKWHQGVIEKDPLRWTNEAGASWLLTLDLANGLLVTGADNPYHDKESGRAFHIILRHAAGGKYLPQVDGFQFNNEFYRRVDSPLSENNVTLAQEAAPAVPRVLPQVVPKVSAASLLKTVKPEYSQAARKLRVEGKVIVRYVIQPDGSTGDVSLVQSIGYGLDENAIAAVRQWQYKPMMKDGVPTPLATQAQIPFELVGGERSKSWYSGPMVFASSTGVAPPTVRDGTIPKPGGQASNESVVLEFNVDLGGSVKDIHPVSGSATSSELLSRYLATWKFQPALKDKVMIEATGRVRFVKGSGDEDARIPLSFPVGQVSPVSPERTTDSSAPAASISSVLFSGGPENPTVRIIGKGFNPRPSNTQIAFVGDTGFDYGTSIYIRDSTGTTAFDAGYDNPTGKHDYIGLIISTYTDTLISFTLGSNYARAYHPRPHYQLNEGDSFTAHVRNIGFSGIVHYSPEASAAPPETHASTESTDHVRAFFNEKDGQRYSWVSAGAFRMGCSEGDSECSEDEKPPRAGRIAKGFWLGETEVTQSAYERLTGGNPSYYRGERMPVDSVTWSDAANFCKAIGGRLPSEAEWEYAARGGIAWARYGSLDAIAWYSANGSRTTHPVASKMPNAFGFFDMLGNVWEWVENSPDGGAMRIERGGSAVNDSQFARASSRRVLPPTSSNGGTGFRCAADWPIDNEDPQAGAAAPNAPAVNPTSADYSGLGYKVYNPSSDGVSAPQVLHRVDPEYSEEARKAKYNGTVTLHIVIDAKGKVARVDLVRGVGMGLDEKAIACVWKWKFKPGYKDGTPVAVAANVEINFRLL